MTPYGLTLNSIPAQTQSAGWSDWVKNYFHPPPPKIAPPPPDKNRVLQDYARYGPKPTEEWQTPPPRQGYIYQGDVPENTPGPRMNPPDIQQFDHMLDWGKLWSENYGWGA